MARPPTDFSAAPRRSRFEAALLDRTAGQIHKQHGDRKAEILGALTGTVIEIGPGTGANMRYYPSEVHVIGIEPNPEMHDRLRDKAERHGVDLELRSLRGEQLDVDDESADAVVATMVLCGVDDPQQVVAEVRRVLKPGGLYFFLEHVRAPEGTATRRVQAFVKRPHRWLFNGCEVDRATADLLREAGFSAIEVEEVDAGRSGLYVRHQIVGTAIR